MASSEEDSSVIESSTENIFLPEELPLLNPKEDVALNEQKLSFSNNNQNSSSSYKIFENDYYHRYEHLMSYYTYHKLIGVNINTFFVLNYYLCGCIKLNIPRFDSEIKNFVQRFFPFNTEILCRWEKFKEFLLVHFNKESTFENDQLDSFTQFLIDWVNGSCLPEGKDIQIPNEDITRKSKTWLEFVRAFIIFTLDAHLNIVLNESEPHFKLTIHFYETEDALNDHDIYFHFINLDLQENGNEEIKEIENEEKGDDVKLKYSKIREKFKLNSVSEHSIFGFIILNTSIWLMVLKIILSGMSVVDLILDIIMVYKFWIMQEKLFSILTGIILIGSGVCNIYAERQHLSYGNKAIYLNNQTVKPLLGRDFLSFLQLSGFVKTVKYCCSLIKRKRQSIEDQMLDNLTDTHPEFLVEDVVILKHVETYLEAIPQTILQCCILLYTQKFNTIQILQILNAVFNINLSTLCSMAHWRQIKLLKFLMNWENVLIAVSYNCSFLLSYSLLFYKCPAIFVFFIIFLHIYIGYHSKMNNTRNVLFFKTFEFQKCNYWQVFNIATIIEHCLYISLLSIIGNNNNTEFQIFLTSYAIFSIIWIILVTKKNFVYEGNVMYLPYYARDRWSD